MIDKLRDQIRQRLEELAAEADQLHTALRALDRGAPAATSDGKVPARRAASSASASRNGRAATTAPARRTRRAATRSARRTPSGSTKAAVLAALAGGDAMTASQVATKAGLGRPTVSTTLSKLAKSGEVEKAARGYQLPAGERTGATTA